MATINPVFPTAVTALTLVLFNTACSPGETIEDPFAWCAAAGTTGLVDNKHTDGAFPAPLVNAMVAQGLMTADAPAQVQQANRWRCMNGAVLVCPLGANLPCAEKADLSREPSQAMSSWCEANANSDIPAYVTGRATVYRWKCNGTTAAVDQQIATADDEGYLAEFWYSLDDPGG